MTDKFIDIVDGVLTQKKPVTVRTGEVDAGKIVAVNDEGFVDPTILPVASAAYQDASAFDVAGAADTAIENHVADPDPHVQYIKRVGDYLDGGNF